jgi:flagellin
MVGINTNVNALNAAASLASNSVTQATAMQQLSTGMRINSAKDDAAGLAIATTMNSNIRGLNVAVRNANDGISMAQTAESNLASVTNMLQRMRELAVQASNGTLSTANRASSQLEVKQLQNEIDNISSTANFNGIKLFDGSAGNITLQTNVNAGNFVKMSIGPMSTNTIGLGSRSSLTSSGLSKTATTGLNNVMQSGDLIINGVTIGSSTAADDTLSFNAAATNVPSDNASSAIAKVAAINRASALTGVTATVNQTVASGVAMTAAVAAQIGKAGVIAINGVTTGSITLQGNTGLDRQSAVTAINAISGQTGVVAVDTGNDSAGVQLIAADGRNITTQLYSTTGAAATFGTSIGVNIGTTASTTLTGTAATHQQNTFSGTYTLQSTTGSPITISTSASTTASLARSGFNAAGTYTANTSFATTSSRNGTPATAATAGLASGDLVINGVQIGASYATDDTSSDLTAVASQGGNSAIAIAAAINKQSALTGVTAKAAPNVIVSTLGAYTGASASGTFLINNVAVTVGTTAGQVNTTASTTLNDIITGINQVSGQSGVVATDNGNGITLTAADGRNISLTSTGTSTAAVMGLTATTGASTGAAATYFSSVTLSSSNTFTIKAGAGATSLADMTALGFSEGTFGGVNNGTRLSQVDVSTVTGAQTALSAIDAAIGQISDQRSNLGAIQNRLSSAVDNLTSYTTNLQSSVGRIQDTDYSSTTTTMSKSQIIAQAATAMLAQANQQPQLVLSLLK